MATNDTDVPASDDETEGGSYRASGTLAIVAVLLAGLFLGLSASSGEDTDPVGIVASDSTDRFSGVAPSRMVLGHLKLRDTVYTTDSLYLELNLVHQRVTVHHRGGGMNSYPVSSGTPYIREGMATPPGLYTVQSMTPMAISRQFNNARLHHWIGIQGGIGFHGLDGTGYYGHLGVRPSSHGCVRMSKADIKEMYRIVHPGALILVHRGEPARVVAFCDPGDTIRATLIDSANVFNRNLGRDRLRSLLAGMAWIDPQPRVVHLAHQRLRWGLEVGSADRIPKQKLPDSYTAVGAAALVPVAAADFADRAAFFRMRRDAEERARRIVQLHQSEWSKEKAAEPEYGE
jgi:hypothetical protein